MPTTVELAKLYVANLAQLWKLNSLTAILENPALVQVDVNAQADEVKVPVITVDGLSDYSRQNGYADGNASLTWATRKLNMDRGKKFLLDTVDNIESMGVMGGNLLAEFQRTRVVPEVDAYRFAKIAQNAPVGHRAYGEITTADGADSALNVAIQALDDAEVPSENRILFCTPAFYGLLKQKYAGNRWGTFTDTNVNRNFEMLDGMKVVKVPQTRFYLGWQKDSTRGYINEGSKLNFLLVHKDACLPVVKHNPIRIFSPEQNQSADGYVMNFRLFHDCFVAPQKEAGIYVHTLEDYTEETVDDPVITVTGDNTASVKFTVSGGTTGASYYYTTDGSTPTSSSSAYSSQVTITDTTIPSTQTSEKTIKVIGIKSGMLSSVVASKKVKVVGSGT